LEYVLLPEMEMLLPFPFAKAVLPPANIIDARTLAAVTFALRQNASLVSFFISLSLHRSGQRDQSAKGTVHVRLQRVVEDP
jgi:hypothetical protein